MGITHYIAKTLINYESEKSFAFKLRRKRAERIILLIEECYNEHRKVDIIDIGGIRTYWKIIPDKFLVEKNVHIVLVNLPSARIIPENDDIFTYVTGDGCNLSNFKDNSFHIAHSNSVIEHVGNWENMMKFSQEIKRVAKTNYIQTPNYWFPIEPHFVTPFYHWLPKSIRIKLISYFDLGWHHKAKTYTEAKRKVESCNLLKRKDLIELFPEHVIYNEKIWGLIKSLIAIRK